MYKRQVKNVNINGGTLYFGDNKNQTFQNTVFNLTGGVVDGITGGRMDIWTLSLIHISEPTRLGMISYAVFCLKKKKKKNNNKKKKQ